MELKTHIELLEVQAAIYRLALSVDAFLLNGIPCGVIQREIFQGFLEKTSGNLLTELANLEKLVLANGQPNTSAILASLRTKCQQLVDGAAMLTSFRTMPLDQVRSTVSQIPLFREACVQKIQELEECFRIPKPFYKSRPAHSTAAINDFLANLEKVFLQERKAGKTEVAKTPPTE